MKPSIGRIVHYFPIQGGDPLPGIIVNVHPVDGEEVDLQVFTNQKTPSVFFAPEVLRRSHPEENHTWDWPPRVE